MMWNDWNQVFEIKLTKVNISKMREKITDLPDVAKKNYPGYQRNGRWIGASITRAFCFYHTYFVLLAIPSDNYWKFLLINQQVGRNLCFL